jgi:hypothetical protein
LRSCGTRVSLDLAGQLGGPVLVDAVVAANGRMHVVLLRVIEQGRRPDGRPAALRARGDRRRGGAELERMQSLGGIKARTARRPSYSGKIATGVLLEWVITNALLSERLARRRDRDFTRVPLAFSTRTFCR